MILYLKSYEALRKKKTNKKLFFKWEGKKVYATHSVLRTFVLCKKKSKNTKQNYFEITESQNEKKANPYFPQKDRYLPLRK